MTRPGSLILILLGAFFCGKPASAQQSLRLRTEPPYVAPKQESAWEGGFRYSMATDYADTNAPRGYTNLLIGGLTYKFNSTWSVQAEAGGRAEFFDGQIDKGKEQSYDETMSPTTSLELDMEGDFGDGHKYSLFVHGEPLWDEASRLEGYKGLIGGGGDLKLRFFGKRYTFANSVDVTELYNTFYSSSDLTANPDYFVTYKMTHSVRLFRTWKVSYAFGLKTTRYLDGFWGYNYENAFTLAKAFGNMSVALSYENGGFTDDGTLSLWYIDEYRRIGRLSMSYTF